MAKLAQTIRQARALILKRANAEGSESYEDMLITLLNQAALDVMTFADWEFLRKRTTISITDNTGIVELPDDLDRILNFYKQGGLYILTKVDPDTIELYRNDSSKTNPEVFCIRGMVQAHAYEAPNTQVEIYYPPSSGDTLILWYVRTLDAFTEDDLDTVPLIPPHMWELIMEKATLELLKVKEADPKAIVTEERHYMTTLTMFKQRELRGSSRRDTFGFDQSLVYHYDTRGEV